MHRSLPRCCSPASSTRRSRRSPRRRGAGAAGPAAPRRVRRRPSPSRPGERPRAPPRRRSRLRLRLGPSHSPLRSRRPRCSRSRRSRPSRRSPRLRQRSLRERRPRPRRSGPPAAERQEGAPPAQRSAEPPDAGESGRPRRSGAGADPQPTAARAQPMRPAPPARPFNIWFARGTGGSGTPDILLGAALAFVPGGPVRVELNAFVGAQADETDTPVPVPGDTFGAPYSAAVSVQLQALELAVARRTGPFELWGSVGVFSAQANASVTAGLRGIRLRDGVVQPGAHDRCGLPGRARQPPRPRRRGPALRRGSLHLRRGAALGRRRWHVAPGRIRAPLRVPRGRRLSAATRRRDPRRLSR